MFPKIILSKPEHPLNILTILNTAEKSKSDKSISLILLRPWNIPAQFVIPGLNLIITLLVVSIKLHTRSQEAPFTNIWVGI